MNEAANRLAKALANPSAVFRSPAEVEHDPDLSLEDKLAILESWEDGERELLVAEEENMGGGERSRLAEVVAARVRIERGRDDA